MDFAGALSPALGQAAGYLYPNTPMAVKPLFHLRSDSSARPFNISFSPNPTACHHCPHTTIGADINITGPPPTPLTPRHSLARCYRHSSPPPTIPAKNLGAPHTLTPNISDPTPTSCMNARPNHHAHSGSSHLSTSDGRNLHHQHDGHSLVTPILHPHQASILYNSSDLAYLRHTAHYYVMLLISFNFIPQPLHLTSTLSSLWKIHTP